MKLKVILFLMLLSFDLMATEIYMKGSYPEKIKLRFTASSPAESIGYLRATNSFSLTHENGIVMQFTCENLESIDVTDRQFAKSFLTYRNIANIEVGRLYFKNNESCLFVAKFVQATFEFINEKNYVDIEINTKSETIEKVYLPNLSPYMDELPLERELDPKFPSVRLLD